MKEKISKIKTHIESNYRILVEEKENKLILKDMKYDIEIKIEEPNEEHYLYKKSKYILYFNYTANKKYQSELKCAGGGYSTEYKDNDYNQIDEFLKKWFNKEKQLSIFDGEINETI